MKNQGLKKYYLVILNMIIWSKIYMNPQFVFTKNLHAGSKNGKKLQNSGLFCQKIKPAFEPVFSS